MVKTTLAPIDEQQAAVLFLMEWLTPSEINKIRTLFNLYGHEKWLWHWNDEYMDDLYPQERKYAALLGPQFGLGMQVRNALRRGGFNRGTLGDLNHVYVDLLEMAALNTARHNPATMVFSDLTPPPVRRATAEGQNANVGAASPHA